MAFFTISLGEGPLIATAIHDGHAVRPDVAERLRLTDAERLREEDPFTGELATVAPTRVLGGHSRFEVDLNRPPQKAVYRVPEDAWGLDVWGGPLPADVAERSMRRYRDFYDALAALLDEKAAQGPFVIYDLHSYNHRRGGPHAEPAPSDENPEINVGTGSLDRDRWGPLVDRFIGDLRQFERDGAGLDVRENVKFTGGYLSQWVHAHYPHSACVLAVEFKKTFMDEWTGTPDRPHLADLKRALETTVPGVLEELARVDS